MVDAHHLIKLTVNPKMQPFRPGDTVMVNLIVQEGERQRIQTFQGVLIRVRGGGPAKTFTVRRITHNIGVERTFSYYSPAIDSVEVLRRGQVRRARLYYLRGRIGKAARIKEKGFAGATALARAVRDAAAAEKPAAQTPATPPTGAAKAPATPGAPASGPTAAAPAAAPAQAQPAAGAASEQAEEAKAPQQASP